MHEEFLEEYRKLCLKYRFCISSCGCCGGPFVALIGDDKVVINGQFSVNLDKHMERLVEESEK